MKKDFKPHMMYDPKTGKGVKANTYKKHLELKKKGYVHDKPKKSFTEAVESRLKKKSGY
tara:strand:- start:196 stop:372 length:177 start_codon:yes stop_codon:yes gene_type:complete